MCTIVRRFQWDHPHIHPRSATCSNMCVKFGHIANFGPCFFCVLGVELQAGSSVARTSLIRGPEGVEMKIDGIWRGTFLAKFRNNLPAYINFTIVQNFMTDPTGPFAVSNDIGKVLKFANEVWGNCQFRSVFLFCIGYRISRRI